jgi:hypothetical protein
VQQHEADLRLGPGRLATAPLQPDGAVLVCGEPAADRAAVLRAVPAAEVAARFAATPPYASGQPGWARFEQKMAALGVHELRRTDHPRDGVAALRRLLGDG